MKGEEVVGRFGRIYDVIMPYIKFTVKKEVQKAEFSHLSSDGQILSLLNKTAATSKLPKMSPLFQKMVKLDNKYLALFIQLTDSSIKYDRKISPQIQKIQNALAGNMNFTCKLCLHSFT